ncbi:Aste57867_21701 [Aphanomyces stellatus]|uniref:Aste57867_21701 protein n=1 Tax=Aphanomyces stellatus TaxID=120398 RepID=A0A485LJF7_9STRA|nr:hypothetical protein As57867_021632 [Aphanomyces stellatus]VFT98370.1 Aste57867_21701 [Aphanomyces stellatus]
MVQLRNVNYSVGKAVVTNARQQHLHSCSFVPKDPVAVFVFLPGHDESCLRYEGLFRFLASQQIAVFALEQNPSDKEPEHTAMYKHPNPEVNFRKQLSNTTLLPAPAACGVPAYVDDVHQFALGVAQRIGAAHVNYFLCGVYYGGLMAAHTSVHSAFPWKGIIMTAPDLTKPVSVLASLTTSLTDHMKYFMSAKKTTFGFASFRDKLMPRTKDHMGNDFEDTTERTMVEDENKSESGSVSDEAFKELDQIKDSLHVPVLILNGKTDTRKAEMDANNFFLGLSCEKKEMLDFKELYTSLAQENGSPDVNDAILKWIHSFQAEWI